MDTNIYFLDSDPRMCAYAHCDEHIEKMISVYTQLLCNAHHQLDPKGEIIKYLNKMDPKYPWIQMDIENGWVKDSNSNYHWLHDLWFWMHKEFWYRYDEMHETWEKLYNKLSHVPENIETRDFVPPPQRIEESFIVSGLEDDTQNSIAGYRNWYTDWCKNNNAKWGGKVENMRTPPSWILEHANV